MRQGPPKKIYIKQTGRSSISSTGTYKSKPQWKTTSSSLEMSIIKKEKNKSKCWKECRIVRTLIHCWWKFLNVVATLEENLAVPQKVTQQFYS